MKKYLLVLLAAALVPIFAVAQQPAATTPSPTPNFCDVTYAADVETADGNDVTSAAITVRAQPWADVTADHGRQVKVLKVISQEQNKGGPYTVTVTETNTCDNGTVTKRIPDGSLYAEGVTLEGSTKIMDEALKMATEVNQRYKDRAKSGAKVGWNHKNAKMVERNEYGQRVHGNPNK